VVSDRALRSIKLRVDNVHAEGKAARLEAPNGRSASNSRAAAGLEEVTSDRHSLGSASARLASFVCH
jgi:hypothetical protein